MATTVEDEKSLEKEYHSLKRMLEEPWLKCGQCGENYRGSTEKLLADEFFENYRSFGSLRGILTAAAGRQLAYLERARGCKEERERTTAF